MEIKTKIKKTRKRSKTKIRNKDQRQKSKTKIRIKVQKLNPQWVQINKNRANAPWKNALTKHTKQVMGKEPQN